MQGYVKERQSLKGMGRRVNLWLIICCALLWWGSAPKVARASNIPNEIYVYYNANHIPSTSGNLTDIGNTSSYTNPHIWDSYNNSLFLDTQNYLVYDDYSQVVGFIYH